MHGVEIDTKALVSRLTEIEKRRLPQITLRALNDSAFETREAWADEAAKVFDRPTSLTLRAPLYRKATLQKLEAEVFIRDDATKGTPPATYLTPQVRGGPRQQKRGERALSRAAGFSAFYVPAPGAPLDQFGNVKRGLIQKILSQLQASHDPAQRETGLKRGRRLGRQRRRGGGGSYFIPAAGSHLKRDVIYERIVTGFGSSVRPVLVGVNAAPTYRKRYDVFKLAQEIFGRRFSANFRTQLTIATRGRL
jgi:hypothetical protein